MDTKNRVNELLTARGMTLCSFARKSGISYSTLKMAQNRQGQYSLETIELICKGLNITLSEFFADDTI